MNYEWPDEFPENCPPPNAVSSRGTYYRVVKHSPPSSSDFVSVYNENQGRADRLVESGDISQCRIMGLSVLSELSDAIQCIKWMPRMGSLIATVATHPEEGKMLATPARRRPSHHTWWVIRGFDPSTNATIVFDSSDR